MIPNPPAGKSGMGISGPPIPGELGKVWDRGSIPDPRQIGDGDGDAMMGIGGSVPWFGVLHWHMVTSY